MPLLQPPVLCLLRTMLFIKQNTVPNQITQVVVMVTAEQVLTIHVLPMPVVLAEPRVAQAAVCANGAAAFGAPIKPIPGYWTIITIPMAQPYQHPPLLQEAPV